MQDTGISLMKLCCCLMAAAVAVGQGPAHALAMTPQDVFPGLRRPPPPSAKVPIAPYDENYLSQILNFIEEQARRRFQEKLKHYQAQPMDDVPFDEDEVPLSWEQRKIGGPAEPSIDDSEFTYKLPVQEVMPSIDKPYKFGVGPNDPRFYETGSVKGGGHDTDSDYNGQELTDGPYFRIKSPLNVNPKQQSKEMQGLLEKLGHNMGGNGGGSTGGTHDVIQRPIDLEGQHSVSIYAVALIAGVSAAITIGLIALGVGWYTFYKKSKAAQDVEYPAYGITGPNKEKFSPTSGGDRRLAQNAQMYHYQHQKQQIIAMENKMGENGTLSDVNSDDENDEGDYTVYECPGLAPTGEMEVKNPLFFDDPTPATPASGAPTTSRMSSAAATATASTSSRKSPPRTTPKSGGSDDSKNAPK